MKRTSFGAMHRGDFGAALAGDFEVMHFSRNGRPHKHDRTEFAICVKGDGFIISGGERVPLWPGVTVMIPPDVEHHMEPTDNETLAMVILYQNEKTV